MNIINWDIIRHPLNWLTIILMVMIAGFVVDIFIGEFTDVHESKVQ